MSQFPDPIADLAMKRVFPSRNVYARLRAAKEIRRAMVRNEVVIPYLDYYRHG